MAMSTTNAAVATGTIVTVGRWSEGQTLTMRVVVGAVFLAMGLSAVGALNDNLGHAFAVLILTAAVLRYAKPIIDKTGIGGGK